MSAIDFSDKVGVKDSMKMYSRAVFLILYLRRYWRIVVTNVFA